MTNWDAAVSFTTSLPQWPRKKKRVFLLENVKGLVTQHRPTFDHILKDMRRIVNGAYKVGYRIMDTANYGIPQHRERVYIVRLLHCSLVPTNFKWPEPCKCQPLPKVLRWPTDDDDK